MSTTLASSERAGRDRLLHRAQEIGQAEMTRLLARTRGSAELFQRAQLAFSASIRNRLESLLVAAALYWLLTSVFTFFQSRLERRISKGYVRTEVGGGGTRRRTQFMPVGGGGGPGGGATMVDIEIPDEDVL